MIKQEFWHLWEFEWMSCFWVINMFNCLISFPHMYREMAGSTTTHCGSQLDSRPTPLWTTTEILPLHTEDQDQEVKQTEASSSTVLRYRLSQWQTRNKQGAKGISTVITKKGFGTLGTGIHFYIQLIILLLRVEYFYFSPCQGLCFAHADLRSLSQKCFFFFF